MSDRKLKVVVEFDLDRLHAMSPAKALDLIQAEFLSAFKTAAKELTKVRNELPSK